MPYQILNRGYNELTISDEVFICADPVRTQGLTEPTYVIPELKPTDLRLRLRLEGTDLMIKTYGNTQLTWFDLSGQGFTQNCHRLPQKDGNGDFYFLAIPEGKTQAVSVKLRIINLANGWVVIFVNIPI